jgi:hypothetical protein
VEDERPGRPATMKTDENIERRGLLWEQLVIQASEL